ncbi:outer membrane receptor for ferric coprogen and ferric-rhodotorulic acid [Sphingobium fontiphilum]|uniref:Outer membrane receptor for ferric coprogen and ferric-rhodotorulic acid n=1 Tax=Sphingobium fontiphilum TaxID=944425 RepID=A0A7W6DIR4_9SPHN|nr:TonB-dependent receptor plug domain-containing protein [Sphingobium fontiphilum]MBB3981390.1 outer membrane receptor for ferric coprogen and ferric-rhodotorulic acid [Sphingobium fontiphilum]
MRTSIIALSSALAATSPALAQDASTTPGWTPEIVVTGLRDGYDVPAAASATRVATPVEKIPQSIQALTRQLIEDQDLQNLTDALVNVSGVVPTSQAQAVLQPTLVRGFKVNYFVDGIPTYQLPEGAADPATLVFVDRIEVAKGPTATLYGGGAGAPLSGLVNLVSRDPSTAKLSASVGLRAGSFNTWGGDADINLPLGEAAAFRVSGRDGNILTGAVVSAGLDFAIALVEQLRGRAYAEALVLQGEYAPDPSIKGGTLATTSAPVGEMMSEMFAPVASMFRAMAKS